MGITAHGVPIFGYDNFIDEAILEGGSWLVPLPLNHLKTRAYAEVARSSDTQLTSTQFSIRLASGFKTAGVIALINHNFTTLAKIRITVFRQDKPVYQTDWESAWGVTIPYSDLEWEDDNYWSGLLSESARKTHAAVSIHLLETVYSADRWDVEISDVGNSAGYLDIGRVFISSIWKPKHSFKYGLSFGYEDPTTVETSFGGVDFFQKAKPYRIAQVEMPYIEPEEVYLYPLDMLRRMGTSGEVLFIPDSYDLENRQIRSFIGRLRQLNSIEYPFPEVYATAFEIKELL